jgi:hypothetical protein
VTMSLMLIEMKLPAWTAAFLVDQTTASDLVPPATRLVLPTFLPPQQHLPHLVDDEQCEHFGGHWGSGHSLSDTRSIDDTARSLHKS